jgi:hypothetical protein
LFKLEIEKCTYTTGLGFFAEDLEPSAKAQKPSAKKNPRQNVN